MVCAVLIAQYHSTVSSIYRSVWKRNSWDAGIFNILAFGQIWFLKCFKKISLFQKTAKRGVWDRRGTIVLAGDNGWAKKEERKKREKVERKTRKEKRERRRERKVGERKREVGEIKMVTKRYEWIWGYYIIALTTPLTWIKQTNKQTNRWTKKHFNKQTCNIVVLESCCESQLRGMSSPCFINFLLPSSNRPNQVNNQSDPDSICTPWTYNNS